MSSEAWLIRKAKKGDTKAYGELIQLHKDYFYRNAFCYVKNVDLAGDVFQEAVTIGMLSIKDLKNPNYFRTWMTRIIYNCANEMFRKAEKEIGSLDAEILKERGVWIAHNPCSNMKLSSGIFASDMLLKKGCRLTLGTDGTASNNNLDMREEMKFAALLAKVRYTSETLPAGEILRWATRNGAQAAGLDAGVIREGALADAVFLDLENERLVPNFKT